MNFMVSIEHEKSFTRMCEKGKAFYFYLFDNFVTCEIIIMISLIQLKINFLNLKV